VCVEQARATGKALPEDDVKKVTECLEDLGESIPDALESDAVAIFVNIAICDGDMGDGERILYLLAVSLSTLRHAIPANRLSNHCQWPALISLRVKNYHVTKV